MNKKMREILSKIQEKTAQAKAFMADGENKDVAKANELLNDVDTLKEEYETEKRLYELEKEENTPTDEELEEKDAKNKEVDSLKQFGQDARNGFKVNKATMVEGTPADGGYTVPEDIQTRINTWRESKASLLNLVRVEKVKTNKGQRTFKKRAQQTGFTKVGEGGKIGAGATPQFERLDYEISKYAGYFPVTNELLADSDANIGSTLIEWIGDESRVTANKLILDVAKTFTAEVIDPKNPIDSIKEILNVKLGSAFKGTSKIITNDNGLQFLDTLKDADGKYLLQPNPAEPMKMQLCAGTTTIPVVVIPNADLPNDTTKIPFIIGDLNEGVVYWDRQQMSITVSNTAMIGELNAFEEDLTLYRAIEREDVTKRDDQAVRYCTLDTAGVAATKARK
nr:MAG TPA: major capsid protein [Caudoviricetes sp.]